MSKIPVFLSLSSFKHRDFFIKLTTVSRLALSSSLQRTYGEIDRPLTCPGLASAKSLKFRCPIHSTPIAYVSLANFYIWCMSQSTLLRKSNSTREKGNGRTNWQLLSPKVIYSGSTGLSSMKYRNYGWCWAKYAAPRLLRQAKNGAHLSHSIKKPSIVAMHNLLLRRGNIAFTCWVCCLTTVTLLSSTAAESACVCLYDSSPCLVSESSLFDPSVGF